MCTCTCIHALTILALVTVRSIVLLGSAAAVDFFELKCPPPVEEP